MKTRKKTMQQIQDLQRQLAPSADKKAISPVAMDLDAIVRYEENKEEEDGDENATKEVRTNEDPDPQDYWEAGLTTETLSA